jgi:hypothetical protein
MPLQRLKQEGVLRNIHCVTWDTPEIDRYVAPLQTLQDIRLTRVLQPDAEGRGNQRGVVYQVENLKAALALVPDDPLILKLRPDYVVRYEFLREKIASFAANNVVPSRDCKGVTMPSPVFKSKVWIPWADANSPFFFEDAAFLGERCDVAQFTVSPTTADWEILGDPHCGSFAHVVRFAKPFLRAYPLSANYVRLFRLFRHEHAYRKRTLPALLQDGFFWHLLIANAWILHSHFHVDIGSQGDLTFYANAANRDVDWDRFDTLHNASPYDHVAEWRESAKPGWAIPAVSRVFGRLVDDAWQKTMFTSELPDLPHATLTGLMTNTAGSVDGRLAELEATFFKRLGTLHQSAQAAESTQAA